jgi:hypothetical protein
MWAARLLCAAHIQGSLSRCNLCRPLVGEYRNSLMATAAMMAPTIEAKAYNQASLRLSVTIIGPSATLASAFVARRCAGCKVETTGSMFHVREDEPASRVGAGCIGRPEARLVRRVGAGHQPKPRYGNISDRLREVQVDMGNL